ncbi:hypothetical protein SDC9_152606 [bioreactor metagenome]|uniref:Uncharacterized protein n=1 Tax=bioreactor metagenome TaxID=1076179 RepID=A0A645EVA0_9ZZZZ
MGSCRLHDGVFMAEPFHGLVLKGSHIRLSGGFFKIAGVPFNGLLELRKVAVRNFVPGHESLDNRGKALEPFTLRLIVLKPAVEGLLKLLAVEVLVLAPDERFELLPPRFRRGFRCRALLRGFGLFSVNYFARFFRSAAASETVFFSGLYRWLTFTFGSAARGSGFAWGGAVKKRKVKFRHDI